MFLIEAGVPFAAAHAGGWKLMDIAEGQHFAEAGCLVGIKTTLGW